MIPKIVSVKAEKDYVLSVEFEDGCRVLYDLSEDMDQLPRYSDLRNVNGLFENFQLDESGTCVFWNDYVDLPSDTIYKYGKQLKD
ncbi:MAG: DUF2442 domain-containing protein [Alphaproteobacteria bacterium]|nr:DUF2442 domain-containing protein [Alphaproteobacteria bacterium]